MLLYKGTDWNGFKGEFQVVYAHLLGTTHLKVAFVNTLGDIETTLLELDSKGRILVE